MASPVDLSKFRLKEILRNDVGHRLVCLHAVERCDESGENNQTEMTENSAVLIAQKSAFDAQAIEAFFDGRSTFDSVAENDIYTNCSVNLPQQFNGLKATWIFPATQAHIEKYREQDVKIIAETYEAYVKVTLPHIEQSKFSLQWVHNILDHKSEMESLLFEDTDDETGFMLLPDLKWDRKSLDSLYFTAIARNRAIKSIRDLHASHLPLLKKIRDLGTKTICDTYGVLAEDLRVFFHYQPSYYHLHVHFVHLRAEAVGALAGQAHLLNDVIDNIELMPDFYQRKTLHFSIKQNNPLYKKLTLAMCQKNGV